MGGMPDRFARKGAAQKAEYFKEQHRLDWPSAKATKQSKKDVRATKSLEVRWVRTGIVRACVLISIPILTHSKSLSQSTTTTGLFWTSCANCSDLTPQTEYGCVTPSSIHISAPPRRTIIHRTCRALWILCCMHTCTEYDVNWTCSRPIFWMPSLPPS